MRILLTNDDGIHAEGLALLERIAAALSHDVWVVAPEQDQSGLAHSLTLSHPLRLRRLGERRFALSGTPTDCVIMGATRLLDIPPDLVLSGVNSGTNVADHVTYSGTVAGAMEGALLGIRAVALSQAYRVEDGVRVEPWAVTERHAPAVLDRLLSMAWHDGLLVNVNFPACAPDEVSGVRVARQGRLAHGLSVEERRDGRGFPYYWTRIRMEPRDAGPDTDLAGLAGRAITVTPLKLDLTDHAAIPDMAGLFADDSPLDRSGTASQRP